MGFQGTGNPRATKYAQYGSKVSVHYRQLANYQKYHRLAIEKLSKIWGTPLVCYECRCNIFEMLQVNHLLNFSTKMSGVKLWRHVLNLSDEQAHREFNILCVLCNWRHFVERKYGVQYSIEYKGKAQQ